MLERSSAQRLHDEAMRVLQRFGLVIAVWCTVLAGTAPTVDARATLWTGIGLLWAWALASQAIPIGYLWWSGWLLAASGIELLGPLAGTDGWSVAGGASFLALASVALSGRRTWVALTIVFLSLVALARGVVAPDWNVGGGIGTMLIYAFGGLTLTWLAEAVRRAMDDRDELQQRLAEAETLTARAHERAESAARLHDTVLQDLTAITRADGLDDVRRHAGRAANQLRRFLRSPDVAGTSFRNALEAAATSAADGIEISVGVVGDLALGDRERLVVDAVAEAVRNAAEHATPPVRVFAETPATGEVVVWVSDRGDGFDPDEVDPDRLGVRESIVGRMERAGGTASLRSSADGTEWELRLPAPLDDHA